MEELINVFQQLSSDFAYLEQVDPNYITQAEYNEILLKVKEIEINNEKLTSWSSIHPWHVEHQRLKNSGNFFTWYLRDFLYKDIYILQNDIETFVNIVKKAKYEEIGATLKKENIRIQKINYVIGESLDLLFPYKFKKYDPYCEKCPPLKPKGGVV